MDKLSELSKPVAWKFKNADGGDRVSLERKANIYGRHNFQPLYSQEYVSALTQRIAKLESANQSQDDHINQQQDRIESLEKTNAGLGRRLGDAEKRLATPVALVDRRPAASGGICWQHGGKDLPHGTELFTAPPAPAVPDKPLLPPHIYRDLLDMLQEAAIAYGGTQQLRAQLSSALSIHVQPDHPHTRVSAPEGGNGA